MSHTNPNAYLPLILEYRETALSLVETLTVWNNRVVLTEIPDLFNKVYIGSYVEIEKGSPKNGEYKVDYRTGIVQFGGQIQDGVLVTASYYGKGIIRYPADRIYAHTKDKPDVQLSLQTILDNGQKAIEELSKIGDISQRLNHTTAGFILGNNDWTTLAYDVKGGNLKFRDEYNGVTLEGKNTSAIIRVRLPVDPESKYYARVKVTKHIGDGTFSLGADSLNMSYQSIKADNANEYNFFVAENVNITSGTSSVLEGTVSGYNLSSGTSDNKFDPDAHYFDIVIMANQQGVADISRTTIDWLELYKIPNELNVNGDANIEGNASIKGKLNMNNNDIYGIKVLDGQFGNIARSTDEWLRLNDTGNHTSGVIVGGLLRTDSSIQVGSGGSTFLASSSNLTYKGNKIGVADGTLQTNLNADMLDGLDQSVFMRKTANSDLTFNITSVNSKTNGIIWTGLTDKHAIFVEETAGNEVTQLVIENGDGDNDRTVVRNRAVDVFTIDGTKADVNVPLKANVGLTVTGDANIGGTVKVGNSNDIYAEQMTFDGSTSVGLRVKNQYGYFSITPLNSSWMHLYTDRNNVIFNKPVYTDGNAFSSYSGDLNIQRNGVTKLSLGASTATLSSDLTVNNGTNTTVVIKSTDAGKSELALYGDAQGTGRIYVGQDAGYGGGVEYNGDNSPATTGAGADYITLYRRSANVDHWTARNSQNNNDWEFRGDVSGATLTSKGTASVATNLTVGGTASITGNTTIGGTVTVTGNATLNGTLSAKSTTVTALTVNGTSTLNGNIGNGNYTLTTGIINMNGVGNGKGLTWNGTQFKIDVSDQAGTSTTASTHLHLKGSGTTKIWMPLEVVGGITVTGDITPSGDIIVADGKSIRPATPEGATLGTPTHPFQDLYIGANSLYVDGKKVVSSQADTIDITTDPNQHLSINTSGLGTTRLASGKEVILFSNQQVNLQSGGGISALSSGLISLKSDVNGSGVELVSQSALGNINLTSGNRIEFSATNDITFLKTPKVNSTLVQLVTDLITASRISQTSSYRFVTDADKTNWNGKVNRSGDTMTGFLTLHADPTSPLHAVTKQYVDAIKQSLDIKDSVRVATTANITLSGGQTIDGIVLGVGNRVLVKNQTDEKQNGIYVVQSGAWTRAIDFDQDSDVTSGAFVFVEEGAVNANMGFVLVTDGAINIGVTPISFTQFSGAGQVINGTGLYKNGNEIGISNTGIGAGTYKSVTVNAQGQVTAGTNPNTLSGYGITDALNLAGGTMTGDISMNGNKITGVNSIHHTSTVSFLNGSYAQSINIGNLLVSDSYADRSKVPSVGAYIKGNIVTDGNITATGTVTSTGNMSTSGTVSINGTTISKNADGSLSVQNEHGYIGIAPKNTSYAHIYTDRATFYFNKDILVNGNRLVKLSDYGHGKGIDADTVDGIHGSQIVKNDQGNTINGDVKVEGSIVTKDYLTIGYQNTSQERFRFWYNGASGKLELQSFDNTAWAPRLIMPDRNSPTTHDFLVNGVHKIFHEGNLLFGHGNGVDADTVDGIHATSFVRTDANSTISTSTLSFGSTVRQMINLFSTSYAVGVQTNTTYIRTGERFSVFKGGIHASTEDNAGTGGTSIFTVSSAEAKWLGNQLVTVANYGHGKSLDADTVDGKHATDFLASTTPYVGLDQSGNATYPRLFVVNNPSPDINWIRIGTSSASSGLIPYQDGISSLGTSSWKFNQIHGNSIYGGALYEGGTSLGAKYLGISANAVSATKLATARTISLTGNVTGSVSFDGTANVSISATVTANSHAHTIANVTGLQTDLDSKLNLAGGTLTGTLVTQTIQVGNTGAIQPTLYRDSVSGGMKFETIGGTTGHWTFVNGNVGIGVTPTNYRLDVNGNTNISGNITTTGQIAINRVSSHIQLRESGADKWHIESVANDLKFVRTSVATRVTFKDNGDIVHHSGKITTPRIQASDNAKQVVFSAGQIKQTVTHNFGNTNYRVALGSDSFARHVIWSNKQINTVDIELDEAYDGVVTVDCILLPF